ncbi:MAG TPA: SIMPL domain-containing protein, partial [Fimbriimonadaceae bacterium]|nr:SIMPL domain-containing protein [Fimbriimonadaceae bacterium]
GAQTAANEIMNRFLQRLDVMKIDKANIRTSRLFLNPVYANPRPGEPAIISGYQASNTISVRLTDFTQIGPVVDAGIAAGVNTIEGVSFGLRDDTKQRMQALKEAVTEARAKAEAMAEALGMALGDAYEVQESGGYMPQPMMMGRAGAEMADASSTPVEPGQLSINASVTIRYRLLPRSR